MTQQRTFRADRFLWLITGFVLLVFGVSLAWSVVHDRQVTELREASRLLSQAKVVDNNLQRQLQATHSALMSVRTDLVFLLYQPGGLALLNRRLQALRDAMPGVSTMLLLNRQGYALASDQDELVGRNFMHREYFTTAQAGNDVDAMYVSQPSKTELGTFGLNLSIVMRDDRGRFSGIVTATLDEEYFNTLMESVRYTDDVWTALAHGDGLMVTHVPARPELQGANLAQPGSMFNRHKESGQPQSLLTGVVKTTGLDSMLAHVTVQPPVLGMDKPLVLAIARSQQDIFSSWRREASLRLAMFLIVALVSGLGVHFHLRRQRFLQALSEAQEAKRMQAEMALRESEHFAREMADNIPGLFAFWKPDLTCGYANKNYLARFGKMQEDVAGMSMQALIGETLFARNQPHVEAVLQGESQQFERALVKADGSMGYTWIQYLPFGMDGQIKGFFAMATDITELKHSQEQQRLSELALQATSQSVAISNANAELIFVNDSFEELTGYSRADAMGINCRLLQGKNTDPRTVQKIREALAAGSLFSGEILNYRKDGTPFWNDLTISTVHDASGQVSNYVAVSRDATTRKQVDESLRISAAAFESQEGIFVTNTQNIILRVNKAFTEMTGYTEAEAIGQTPKLIASGRHDKAFYDTMWNSIHAHGTWQGEIWNRRKSGEVFPESITITSVKDENGQATHFVANFIDISARKSAEDEIKTLAFYDPLTKLPNRRMLLDRLQHLLASSHRHQRRGALLFVDLDNFKTLNDTRGHHLGDLLLEQVAHRLRACVREGDTVARLGGDEFVVMLDNLSDDALEAANEAEVVGEKILQVLNQDYALTGFSHRCTPSIGITLFGEVAETVEEPLKRADMAMYQAKAAGRNTLRFFDVQIQAALTHRTELEARMGAALAAQQFELYYQPQVNELQVVVGAEALVRWNDPERGMVSPGEFIPVAEESGLILPLGQWVLHTACMQIATWSQRPDLAHLSIAVNVSAKQLQADDFVEKVLETLKATGATPGRLKLEITESMLVQNVEQVIAKMSALKALGIGFSMDDFGTGYSSLAYLKRLPLNQLKIDQSFVRDILVDSNDAAISRMVIVLAQSLGLTVIAEGVETAAQRDFLTLQGCHGYQGYLFGRPMPLAAFEASLRA